MPGFDLFLAHNSTDKPTVRRLCRLLTERGLRCWLDEQQILPGGQQQPLIEQGLEDSRSIAICIGPNDFGPWQAEERQAAITLAVRDQHPVIPVLLPGAPAPSELPLLLANRACADLRDGLQAAAIDHLIAGITGRPAVATTASTFSPTPATHPTSTSPLPSLFLSYARPDLDAAQRLKAELETAGHRCWMDTLDLKGGRDWLDAIEQAVSACYAFVTLVSPAAGRSKFVKAEYLLAESLSKPLLPVLIDGELPWYMAGTQAIALDADHADGLQRLLRDLPEPPGLVAASESEPDQASPRDTELAYLRALRLQDVLQQPDLYIHLQGDARHRPRLIGRTVAHLTMRPEFAHMRRRLLNSDPVPEPVPDADSDGDGDSETFDDILQAFPDIRRAVLLGDPGAGKTTTLWKLARDAIERAEQGPEAPLPLLARLGLWTDPDQDLSAFLAEQAGTLGPDLPQHLAGGRLLLLLDGLNEVPVEQRQAKSQAIRELLTQRPGLSVVVSCRDPDYRDDLMLPLDTVTIRPLTPTRIRAFLRRYLEVVFPDDGSERAEQLFWDLAGGDEVQATWQAWEKAEAGLDLFWSASDIPRENPNVFEKTKVVEDTIWHEQVASPYNLVRLGQNPYLLAMLLEVWLNLDQRLPANRGQLFEEAVGVLLAREALADPETLEPTDSGRGLLAALGRLAWALQTRSDATDDSDADRLEQARTSLPTDQARNLIGAHPLDLGIAASLLEGGAAVRFSHQLLQEYFTALGLRERLRRGELDAAAFWPPDRWWQRSGWEEAAVLLAGLYHQDCTPVLEWLGKAQPVVAADCIERSGASAPKQTLDRLRRQWLACLSEGQPKARAAIGQALGRARHGERMIDDRSGVGLRDDGLPDIAWVEIPGGEFIYQKDERLSLPTFHIARYPVTHTQFQAFVDAENGHPSRDWWQGFESKYQEPKAPSWSEGNAPRETVSWYQAMAYCRWLSAGLGFEVRLPTEQEWERAARGRDGRQYPWGDGYQVGFANVDETARNTGPNCLERTSAVGLYPQGRSQEGVDDLAGNVWEWCLNKHDTPKVIETDTSGDRRVLRGGSWILFPDLAAAATRGYYAPGGRSYRVGFRVLCAAPHGH